MVQKLTTYTVKVQPLWKTVSVPQNVKCGVTYDPAIPLLGIYPKELKAGIQVDICTLMYIAALFTTAEEWKQSKCPLTGEWMNKSGINIQQNIIQP